MWKLGLVIQGQASEKLLDTYAHDRQFAADENIMNSTRSTDFITPKSRTSKTFRNQVLALAKHYPFARKLVNSGRLSMPSFLTDSVLNTPDTDAFEGQMVPGAPMDDAPVKVGGQDAWLLDQVGKGFQVMLFVDAPPAPEVLAQIKALQTPAGLCDAPGPSGRAPLHANAPPVKLTPLIVASRPMDIPGMTVIVDTQGLVAKRYDARPGTTYLLRPDQHVVARWRTLDTAKLQAALARATALNIGHA
jgi:3-(3-hydroxy-phenyl)propionate hydroxylase